MAALHQSNYPGCSRLSSAIAAAGQQQTHRLTAAGIWSSWVCSHSSPACLDTAFATLAQKACGWRARTHPEMALAMQHSHQGPKGLQQHDITGCCSICLSQHSDCSSLGIHWPEIFHRQLLCGLDAEQSSPGDTARALSPSPGQCMLERHCQG